VRAAAALALAALALAGCGSTANVVSGGAVPGTTRTVYSLLPHPGEGNARDMVLGQKLAIQEAGGRAGGYGLSFVSLDESTPDPAHVEQRAGVIAEQAIHDPQVIAIFGGTSSRAAKVTVPLVDAAGILHLLPGAGYPGFTQAYRPGEPDRWLPSGGADNVVRLVPDDIEQARALVAAALQAGGRAPGRLRVAVEAEPDADADPVHERLAERGIREVDSVEGADVVIYLGEDVENAAGVARSVTENGTPIVLGDDLVRGGVADRLDRATRRRTILVSSAPTPGSPPIEAIAPAFRAAFGRDPGPYAVVGYEAMKALIAAIDEAAPRTRRRQAVTAAFRPPPARGFTAYRAGPDPAPPAPG